VGHAAVARGKLENVSASACGIFLKVSIQTRLS
jgi:hypothetical protein